MVLDRRHDLQLAEAHMDTTALYTRVAISATAAGLAWRAYRKQPGLTGTRPSLFRETRHQSRNSS
jgi:hypothetical protein